MEKFEIPANVLMSVGKIVLQISKKEPRICMHNIQIVNLNGFATAVATDGHVLLVVEFSPSLDFLEDGIVIPAECIKPLKFTKKQLQEEVLTVEWEDIRDSTVELENDRVTVVRGNERHSSEIRDRYYPKWRNLFSSSGSGTAQLDPRLLYLMGQCVEILGVPMVNMHIEHRGESGAMVSVRNCNAYGLIMPYRSYGPYSLPEWI